MSYNRFSDKKSISSMAFIWLRISWFVKIITIHIKFSDLLMIGIDYFSRPCGGGARKMRVFSIRPPHAPKWINPYRPPPPSVLMHVCVCAYQVANNVRGARAYLSDTWTLWGLYRTPRRPGLRQDVPRRWCYDKYTRLRALRDKENKWVPCELSASVFCRVLGK
jgi:hypothetical protein